MLLKLKFLLTPLLLFGVVACAEDSEIAVVSQAIKSTKQATSIAVDAVRKKNIEAFQKEPLINKQKNVFEETSELENLQKIETDELKQETK